MILWCDICHDYVTHDVTSYFLFIFKSKNEEKIKIKIKTKFTVHNSDIVKDKLDKIRIAKAKKKETKERKKYKEKEGKSLEN